MFDDLRSEAGNSFKEDMDAELEALLDKKPGQKPSRFNSDTFLGMNAFQRFIISVLLFVVVAALDDLARARGGRSACAARRSRPLPRAAREARAARARVRRS